MNDHLEIHHDIASDLSLLRHDVAYIRRALDNLTAATSGRVLGVPDTEVIALLASAIVASGSCGIEMAPQATPDQIGLYRLAQLLEKGD